MIATVFTAAAVTFSFLNVPLSFKLMVVSYEFTVLYLIVLVDIMYTEMLYESKSDQIQDKTPVRTLVCMQVYSIGK